MKWLRYTHAGTEGFGTLDGETIHVHTGELFDTPTPTGTTLRLDEVCLGLPCRVGKVLALWNNFRAAAEKNGWAPPTEPLYFLKSPNSLAPHGSVTPAVAPEVGRVAFEGELAVVIGRRAHRVSLAQAPDHILGYTCADDVTAIELLHRDPAFPQWTRAKGFDGFGVLGPVIETSLDLSTAMLRTRVGGRERQAYPLADMFFPPAELVARISQDLPLEPGDVILCGTSLGVLPMKPGSEVEVTIDGLGTLVHRYG